MMGRIWTITRRELGSYFDHATAYILVVIFLAINFFFYFQDAFVQGEASLRPMMGMLPWLLLFFVPAVCMRSLAEERDAGTLELVLAQPIEVAEFLLGKFLGVFLFLMIAMAGTLGVPIGLSFGADLQIGVMVAQYLGTAFLIAALVGIGLWASSLTRNQVTAFIFGVTITFALYMIGLPAVLLGVPGAVATVLGRLGILGHFENVGRGVVDLRDVLYFLAVTAAFLALTYFSLMRERLSREREAYGRLRIGALGMVGIAVLAALAGSQLRGRLDLTPGKLYTLSGPTEDVLRAAPDLVTIKFFRSDDLPPALAAIRRDVEDLLSDIAAAGGANVNLVEVVPEDDEEVEQEAQQIGITRARFNAIGQDEMSTRDFFMGIAIQYAGETEVIPLVRQTSDLEYRLASTIRSMTRESRSRVALLSGHGEYTPQNRMQIASGMLSEEYDLTTFRIDSTTLAVPDSIDVIVIPSLESPLTPQDGQVLGRFLDDGGSLMVMASGNTVDFQSRFAGPAFHGALDSLLQTRGLGIIPAMAFDVQSSESIQVQSSVGPLILPYPLFVLGQVASNHVIVGAVGPVSFRWASPLLIEVEDSTRVAKLMTTTELGGRLQTPISVDPSQDWEAAIVVEDMRMETLAVAYNEPGGGRIVLAGSASFVDDEVLQRSASGRPGLIFFQNAIDWLAQDEALISIRSKSRTPPQLLFPSELARDAAKYGNMGGVPLLFILFGVLRLARRRKIQQRVYESGGALA